MRGSIRTIGESVHVAGFATATVLDRLVTSGAVPVLTVYLTDRHGNRSIHLIRESDVYDVSRRVSLVKVATLRPGMVFLPSTDSVLPDIPGTVAQVTETGAIVNWADGAQTEEPSVARGITPVVHYGWQLSNRRMAERTRNRLERGWLDTLRFAFRTAGRVHA